MCFAAIKSSSQALDVCAASEWTKKITGQCLINLAILVEWYKYQVHPPLSLLQATDVERGDENHSRQVACLRGVLKRMAIHTHVHCLFEKLT